MPFLSSATLNLELGPLAVRLTAGDGRWLEALAPRYERFRSEAAPRFEIGLVEAGGPPDREALLAMMSESAEASADGERLTLRSRSFTIELDLACGGRIVGPRHRYPVDLALRTLLVATLDDGVAIHGALLAGDDRGFVCAGPSGSGKSTLAGLVGARSLCDELAVVRRGTEGGWCAEALPYWQGTPGRARLSRVFLLAQAPRHQRRPLPRAEAARRLAREILWPGFSPPRMARAFALFADLLAAVPVEELAFRPTPDVWEVLAAPGERAA